MIALSDVIITGKEKQTMASLSIVTRLWPRALGVKRRPWRGCEALDSVSPTNLQQLAQWPLPRLPRFVRESPVALRYLRLLGPLDWVTSLSVHWIVTAIVRPCPMRPLSPPVCKTGGAIATHD
jgi:hypothetical protein